ncbi:MAG TPA: nucleotide exchange factor GrpE [Vicinamibacterales bacterium]|nr:nucleotide exchange factor GrpE [Vicinamibacterales bacterium]
MNDIQNDSGERASAATAEDAQDTAREELQRQRDQFYDLLLRKTAEFDNYRKRIERERQAVTEAAAADLIEDLLPVIDNFERALEAPAGEGDVYRRGITLIHDQLLDVLRKRGVEPIEAVGHDFDPNLHEAVTYEPAPGHRDGEVIGELRRGYTLGDRLLRAAMVKVAKA